MARTAVHILTGFLGSGKTTLLKGLLAAPALSGTAVLVNEFGEVGIDNLLVEALADDVVLLRSGCLCCSVRGDVKQAVLRLKARVAAGEMPPFERLVIETTGLADPAPLLATFHADPMLRHQHRIENVVTVIDAVNGSANLDRFDEAMRQVAAADLLIMSKIDLAGADRAASLRKRLEAINPAANIEQRALGDPAPPHWLSAAPPRPRSASPARTSNPHGDTRSFILGADEPIDWAAFGLWLSMLLNRHGDRILRVKGLLRVAGADNPVLIQGVQHIIHQPEHLPAWPGEPRTEIVMIARDLDPVLVQRSFAAALSLSSRPAVRATPPDQARGRPLPVA